MARAGARVLAGMLGIAGGAGLLLFYKKVTKKLLSEGWQAGLSDWSGLLGQAVVVSCAIALICRMYQAAARARLDQAQAGNYYSLAV